MYDPRHDVGDFFEERARLLFDLVKVSARRLEVVPDLISRDGSYFVEVKASSYIVGGVINRTQLERFDEMINFRRFYAFCYHSIIRDMARDYPSAESLRAALDLRSLFLFPFSIVKAHFEVSRKRTHPRHDDFVLLRESRASAIFLGDASIWANLGLDRGDYKMARPHEKIHIVTREGYLEKQILGSFHPEFV